MPGHSSRVAAAAVAAALLAGCAFTRLTDRAFLGVASNQPFYQGRLFTGLVLLPIAVAADVVSAPMQLIALAMWGDDYLVPFDRRPWPDPLTCYDEPEPLLGLAPVDRVGLEAALANSTPGAVESGQVILGLTPQGEWVELKVTQEQRLQLLTRVSAGVERPSSRPPRSPGASPHPEER